MYPKQGSLEYNSLVHNNKYIQPSGFVLMLYVLVVNHLCIIYSILPCLGCINYNICPHSLGGLIGDQNHQRIIIISAS